MQEVFARLAKRARAGGEIQLTDLIDRVAGLLASGAVVGWFQGAMEFGPLTPQQMSQVESILERG